MFKVKKMTYLSFVMLVATILLGNRAANFMVSFLGASSTIYRVKAEEHAAAPKEGDGKDAGASLVQEGAPVEQTNYDAGTTEDKKQTGKKDEKMGSAVTVEVKNFDAKPLRTLDALEGGVSPSELILLQKLNERRQELTAREEKMKQRASVLSAVEQRMQDKLAELKKMHADFTTLKDEANKALAQMDDKENKRLENLANIYSTMPPKKAAIIFDKLDLSILLDLLPRLKVAISNQILSFMNPDKASTLTTKLAQKHDKPALKTVAAG